MTRYAEYAQQIYIYIYIYIYQFDTGCFSDDNKIKMARKQRNKQKENPVGCTGQDKGWKGNIREGKTGTVLELSFAL